MDVSVRVLVSTEALSSHPWPSRKTKQLHRALLVVPPSRRSQALIFLTAEEVSQLNVVTVSQPRGAASPSSTLLPAFRGHGNSAPPVRVDEGMRKRALGPLRRESVPTHGLSERRCSLHRLEVCPPRALYLCEVTHKQGRLGVTVDSPQCRFEECREQI
jgi:hypothetical protein